MLDCPKLVDVSLRDIFEYASFDLPDAFPASVETLFIGGPTVRCTGIYQGSMLRNLSLWEVNISFNDFAMLATSFPLLEKIMMHNIWCRNADNRHPVVFDKLRSLELLFYNSFPLNIMVAPALECLTLDEWMEDSDDELDLLDTASIEFIRRSNPPMKKFTYQQDNIYPHAWLEPMLREMRDLSELRIIDTPLPWGVLRSLCSASFCPNLRVIRNEYGVIDLNRPTPNYSLQLYNADEIFAFLHQRYSENYPVKLEMLFIPMHEVEYWKLLNSRRYSSQDEQDDLTIVNAHKCMEGVCRLDYWENA